MIIDTQKLVEMVLEIINDDRSRADVKLTRVKQLLEKLKIVK